MSLDNAFQNPIASGFAFTGFTVGVLCLSTRHPLLPGNMQHAQSFGAPVIYQTVHVSDPWQLMQGDTALTSSVIDGVLQLASKGVRAVVGACGSFAYYQKAAAAAAPVPVFLSILTQVPFILQSLAKQHRLGVICAIRESMNPRVYQQCEIHEPERLNIIAMHGRKYFDAMVASASMESVNGLRDEVVNCARELAQDEHTKGILLQCSDLPPFAADIQAHTNLPVFDMTILTRWLLTATHYKRYDGLISFQTM